MFALRSKRLICALLITASVAGCATAPTTGGIPSVREAQSALAIGKSTKAQVEAALGKAIAVHFDSGYEIWVYREQSAVQSIFAQPASERPELVLLFEPSGILKKMRVRTPA